MNDSLKPLKSRSPAYPSMSLPAAVEKVKKIWEAQRKHEAHIDSVLNVIGYSSRSGASLRAIGALNHYGLVEESGAKDERRLKVSEVGQDILHLTPTDSRYRSAVKDAALKPSIHFTLWERYGANLPEDSAIRPFLIRDKGYNETVVSEVLKNYRETIEWAKLGNEEPIGEVTEENDGGEKNEVQNPKAGVSAPKPAQAHVVPSDPSAQELPILVGDNKVAKIPFPMTEDDYDLLLQTLQLWKRKIVQQPLKTEKDENLTD